MKSKHFPALGLVLTASAAAEPLPSTISATDRYAYAANSGWIDFRLQTADGVRVSDTCLAGYAYAANFGFIGFGSGTPANGHTYGNASASDFGVNLSPAGTLTGYAYSANIGWIRFDPDHGFPRIDLMTGKFSGRAYSANTGWISLATPVSEIATVTLSRPDADDDGLSDHWENLHWGDLITANAVTDHDGDGARDSAEYLAATDPRDRDSLLRITAHTYNSDFSVANLTFTIAPTRSYRLEHVGELSGPWTDSTFGIFTPAPAATATRSLTLPIASRRFFRAVAVQPIP